MPNHAHTHAQYPTLPSIQHLGPDLVHSTRKGLVMLYVRPLLTFSAYIVIMTQQWYWLLLPWVGFHFVYLLGLCHEAVHNAAGIGPRMTHVLLFTGGLGLMESGHGFRLSHIRHHADLCDAEDIEGEGALGTAWQAIAMGPLFLPRVLAWALRHGKRLPEQYVWIKVEVGLVAAAWLAMWPLLYVVPQVGAYMVLMWLVSWIKPFSLSYVLHLAYDASKADQLGVSVRGWVLQQVLFGLTWHMEHHLYPQVPTHRLPELAQRLKPWMTDQALIYRWF